MDRRGSIPPFDGIPECTWQRERGRRRAVSEVAGLAKTQILGNGEGRYGGCGSGSG